MEGLRSHKSQMNLRTNSSASNPKYPELKLNIPF